MSPPRPTPLFSWTRAAWHSTDKLKLPKNLSIILLPSRSPELNPVENVWQYLRQNWLSNSVFEDYHAIIDAGCHAWNKLISNPETIMSIKLKMGPYRSIIPAVGIISSRSKAGQACGSSCGRSW